MLAGLTAQPKRVSALASLATLVVFGGAALAGSDASPRTERISVSSGGVQAERETYGGSLSANGRFVAFSSTASNLVRGDENGTLDVFVRDRKTRKTQRVSISSKGKEGNGESFLLDISSNGRYIAFSSTATNLVRRRDRTGHSLDVFLRDRKLHRTSLVSVNSRGKQGHGSSSGASVSGDGHVVAFVSRSQLAPEDRKNAHPDVFVRNLRTRRTELVSISLDGAHGDRYSTDPSLSHDGRFVAFTSRTDNLVAGDKFTGDDVLVRDLKTRKTSLVSVDSNEVQANRGSGTPAISGDGRFVSFWSIAPNLASGHRNGVSDVFLRDLKNGTTEWVSVDASGGQSVSAAFPTPYGISEHGEFVLFTSDARDLVAGDTSEDSEFFADNDVFVRDVANHTTRRVSVSTAGRQGNGQSYGSAISGDGRFVGWVSDADNLVSGDTNGMPDFFVRGPLQP